MLEKLRKSAPAIALVVAGLVGSEAEAGEVCKPSKTVEGQREATKDVLDIKTPIAVAQFPSKSPQQVCEILCTTGCSQTLPPELSEQVMDYNGDGKKQDIDLCLPICEEYSDVVPTPETEPVPNVTPKEEPKVDPKPKPKPKPDKEQPKTDPIPAPTPAPAPSPTPVPVEPADEVCEMPELRNPNKVEANLKLDDTYELVIRGEDCQWEQVNVVCKPVQVPTDQPVDGAVTEEIIVPPVAPSEPTEGETDPTCDEAGENGCTVNNNPAINITITNSNTQEGCPTNGEAAMGCDQKVVDTEVEVKRATLMASIQNLELQLAAAQKIIAENSGSQAELVAAEAEVSALKQALEEKRMQMNLLGLVVLGVGLGGVGLGFAIGGRGKQTKNVKASVDGDPV